MSDTPDSKAKPKLSVRDEIDLIKKENLTGQQLRMARKLAQKHGIESTSDLDAVRILRKQGIDPFTNAGVINPAAKQGQAGQPAADAAAAPAATGLQQIQLPATAQTMTIGAPAAPAGISDADRLKEIQRIQADLTKRRRRRLLQVFAKLMIFVGLPTAIAFYYFFAVASPMYSTFSDFVIQKSEGSSAAAGGLLSGTSFANNTDSIAVQGFLTSRAALQDLNTDHGFRAVFEDENLDPLQRLEPDATNEAAYKIFKKRVKVGYDPTEGVIKMEVIAPTPEASLTFSNALIGYAERQVDQLTKRARDDAMSSANESYQEQERLFQEAQDRVLAIQEESGTVSGELIVQQLTAEIATLRTDLISRRLALAQLENNSRPNKTKVDAQKAAIGELNKIIDELENELTGVDGSASAAQTTAKLSMAQRYLELRQTMLATSLSNKESAAMDASRQSRYLELSTAPVMPDSPSYPKKFENSLLALLVFLGLYLMVSLTASILREQVAN